MKIFQEYLDKQYPTAEEKAQLKEIEYSIQWKNLNGQNLNLTNYPNLEKIIINGNHLNSPLTKLELNNPKLTWLNCSENQLTSLNLTNCPNLEGIYCGDNQLTELNINNLNEGKLTWLSIQNNNITSDLTPLSKFVNLEGLWLENNNFFGSLKPLAGMIKLKWLRIDDTDIESGLEYLPESVKYFYCSADYKKDAKCKIIYNLLENTKRMNFPQKLQSYKQQKKTFRKL